MYPPQIESPHPSIALSTKPPFELESERQTRSQGAVRAGAPRSRLAARVERVLTAAAAGQPQVVLDVKASELLGDAGSVAVAIRGVLSRARPGLTSQWRVTQAFTRFGLDHELLDSLAHADPEIRVAGARLCGALRLTDAVPWLGDLLDDPDPRVRDAAVRALGKTGGRRAVDTLMSAVDRIPPGRLAIELYHAASDFELESLLRQPVSPQAEVPIIMACGLSGDVLRAPWLVGMAQDRDLESRLRVAACRALAMIRHPAAADALRTLATEADPDVKRAAVRARRRVNSALKRRLA